MEKTLLLLMIFIITLFPNHYRVAAQPQSNKEKDTIDAVVQKAQTFYTNGQYVNVIKTLRDTGMDTANAHVSSLLGLSYSAINDYDNALHYLQQACKIDSSNVSYLFQFAMFSAQSGMVEAAKKEYQQIILLDSTYLPAFFQLGLICYNQKSYDQSRVHFSAVIDKNPRDYLAQYYMGAILVALAEQDSAVIFLNNCIQLNRTFVPALDVLASIYYGQKNYTEALQLYRNAAELRPGAADYSYKSGLCYRQLGKHENAIVCFKKAAVLDSTNSSYFAQLGYCYYFSTHCDSSIFFSLKAVSMDDENLSYYSNLALAYQKLDSTNKVADVYQKMVNLHQPDEVANLYFQIGSLYFSKRRTSDAIDAYKKALAVRPTYPAALYYLGECYEEMENISAARKTYEEYMHITASDSMGNASRELVRYRLKELKNKGS